MIYTYTGLNLSPLDIKPEEIRIEDIAHALALCNRFAGHSKRPISVAQHSVWASWLAGSLQALLHDASEAYLGDVTKWLKASPEFAAYRAAENRLQRAIYRRFGCAEEDTESTKLVDNLLVRYEMMRGFGEGFTVGRVRPGEDVNYLKLSEEEMRLFDRWEYWSWERSEREFIQRFHFITGGNYDAPENAERQHGVQGTGERDSFWQDPDIRLREPGR